MRFMCSKLKVMKLWPLLLALVLISAAPWVCPGNGHADDTVPPAVVATNPPNRATGVSRALPILPITFSEPMNLGGIDLASDFPQASWNWSPDQKTLYLTRTDQTSLLDQGEIFSFSLGPNFRDAAGNSLARTDFSFTVGSDTTVPTVVSTSPANGATGVSRDLAQVSITFSEEMAESISISKNFPNFTVSWSQDKRTVYLTRIDQQTPLAFGAIYHFTLNPAGYLNFRDLHYCYLPQTGFSFITAFDPNAPYELMKVPVAPSKGFEWPYYLSIPKGLSKNTTLLVEPNNTGRSTDDWAVHDAAAFSSAKGGARFAVRLNAPLLVPTFPRPLNPSIPAGSTPTPSTARALSLT